MTEGQKQRTEENNNNNNAEEGLQGPEQEQPRGARVEQLAVGWTQLHDAAPPPFRYPHDVVDFDDDEIELVIVGTAGQKITHMGPDLSQRLNPNLTQLVLRSHLIRTMEGLENLECLELLELYDNQVDELKCLADGKNGAPGRTLLVLDMSYNSIRDMGPVALCPNLQELYLANNKLKSMAGLKQLVHLKKIDLGANRIRVMDEEELSGLVNLEELWLGKNKIEEIRGLEKLVKLRRLDVQSNRLDRVENLQTQNATLEELYLSHNGVTTEGASLATGLAQTFPKLSVLDLSRNRLTTTAPFAHLTSLDELWLSGNKIATFKDVEPLSALGKSLDTVYLEYNPVQEDPLYRKKLAELIPSLTQIDANLIAGLTASGISLPLVPRGLAETDEVRVKRLRDAVVDRAKKDGET